MPLRIAPLIAVSALSIATCSRRESRDQTDSKSGKQAQGVEKTAPRGNVSAATKASTMTVPSQLAPQNAPPPATSPAAPQDAPPAATSQVVTDHHPSGYTLVFSDEFSSTALDRKLWCTRYIYGGGAKPQKPDPECEKKAGEGNLDFLNDEVQRYRDVNKAGQTLHELKNGVLTLIASKGTPEGPLYESAMIRSKRVFEPDATRSLYITARVKLPRVRGTWPAFWLNSDRNAENKVRWPPEIDVFEAPLNEKEDKENMLHMGAVAKGQPKDITFVHANFDQKWRNYVAPSGSLRDVWIETGIEWTDGSVCYFVNGLKVMCETYRWIHSDGSDAPPAHILLNLAIGGEWAGRHGIDDAKLPARMSIDYVRVYEKKL